MIDVYRVIMSNTPDLFPTDRDKIFGLLSQMTHTRICFFITLSTGRQNSQLHLYIFLNKV
jgi:hypothetical protein